MNNGKSTEKSLWYKYLKDLNNIRERSKKIQEDFLAKIKEQKKCADKSIRDPKIETILEKDLKNFEDNITQIETDFNDINDIMGKDSNICRALWDTLPHIGQPLEDIKRLVGDLEAKKGQNKVEEIIGVADEIDKKLNEIICSTWLKVAKGPLWYRYLENLNNIRERSKKIQEDFLAKIKEQKELADKSIRDKEIESILKNNLEKFKEDIIKIETDFEDIDDIKNKDPNIYRALWDTLACIRQPLEDVKRLVGDLEAKKGQNKVEEIIGVADEIDKKLNEIIYYTTWLMTAEKVNEHLQSKRIGQSLDFNATFEDEIGEENRKKILEELAEQPTAIDGVIDVESGLIFRASSNQGDWWWSLGKLIGLLILPLIILGVLVVLVKIGIIVKPDQITTYTALATTYIALAVGAIIHVGFQSLKQYKTKKKFQFRALDDILLWIHVRELSLLIEVATIIAVFVLAEYFVKDISWETAFLFGYSYDSFFDLFASRFESVIESKTKALKESSKGANKTKK